MNMAIFCKLKGQIVKLFGVGFHISDFFIYFAGRIGLAFHLFYASPKLEIASVM